MQKNTQVADKESATKNGTNIEISDIVQNKKKILSSVLSEKFTKKDVPQVDLSISNKKPAKKSNDKRIKVTLVLFFIKTFHVKEIFIIFLRN